MSKFMKALFAALTFALFAALTFALFAPATATAGPRPKPKSTAKATPTATPKATPTATPKAKASSNPKKTPVKEDDGGKDASKDAGAGEDCDGRGTVTENGVKRCKTLSEFIKEEVTARVKEIEDNKLPDKEGPRDEKGRCKYGPFGDASQDGGLPPTADKKVEACFLFPQGVEAADSDLLLWLLCLLELCVICAIVYWVRHQFGVYDESNALTAKALKDIQNS